MEQKELNEFDHYDMHGNVWGRMATLVAKTARIAAPQTPRERSACVKRAAICAE